MELLILIITISYITNLFTWAYEPFRELKNYLKLNHYIFYCSKCMGFWFSLPFLPLFHAVHPIIFLCLPFLVSLIAAIIEKILKPNYDKD